MVPGTYTGSFAAEGLDNENIIVSYLYVCVHTVDGYDLEIAVLTLKLPMDAFYVVLQRTFIFTPEVTLVTFEESRSFDRLSL